MSLYEYRCVEDGDERVHLPKRFRGHWGRVYPEELAKAAAKHYTEALAGEVCDPDYWPLVFEIYVRGKSLGVYSVQMDYEPRFYADEVEQEDSTDV